MVDLYYALYGSKRPLCLQSAEINSMYKDIMREGNAKKSTNSSTSSASTSTTPKPIQEIKLENIQRDRDKETLDVKTNITTAAATNIKRTASEAFGMDNDGIKLETHDEITVINEALKDDVYEGMTTKMDTTIVETESYVSETKKLKSEIFDEDDNSITIIDISETTVTRMDSSFDSSKADGESKHKMESSSKVCYLVITNI